MLVSSLPRSYPLRTISSAVCCDPKPKAGPAAGIAYDEMRRSPDPEQKSPDFLLSIYAAAADLGAVELAPLEIPAAALRAVEPA